MKKENILLLICIVLMVAPRPLLAQDSKSELTRLKYNQSDLVVDLAVGLWPSPLPMDYDKDGDLDLVISCTDVPFSGTYLCENKAGKLSAQTALANPVYIGPGKVNLTISHIGDEDYVLAPGLEYKDFTKSGFNNPEGVYHVERLHEQYPKRRVSQWNYVDYEGDGDLDLIVGIDDWAGYGWDNAFNEKGEWTRDKLHGYVILILNEDGEYHIQGRLQAEGEDIDVEGNTNPSMADFDNDGDLDLICGEFVDRFSWFENIGTRENPVFAKGRLLNNGDGLVTMDLEMMRPTAIDWNQDGNMDLLVGDEDGRIAFIENTGEVNNNMPVFKSVVYLKQEADFVKFGALVTPYSVDWDEDGDEDLICGNSAGYICFFENLDGKEIPTWSKPQFLEADGEIIRQLAGYNGSIQGPAERKWGYTVLTVADWDGDGLKDIITNGIWGKIQWYKNVGEKGAPKLSFKGSVKIDTKENPKPKWNWWSPEKDELCTQWRTTPYTIDWNQDGLMDLVMLDHEGYLAFFERFKKKGKLYVKPGKRIFKEIGKEKEDGLLRLSAREAGGSGRRKLCFADWDGDGDLDILANSRNIELWENTGESDGFINYKNKGNVINTHLAGHTTSPTTVDWNKDGVPDLLIGAEDGHLYLYENK
ncbi:FG-GAP repeat domain-containing protein [Sunxiuqinia sp. A32]|uniref:FG-GAP repeat domain-containing protein n=1 Tax=Sunxiuqinia sp. A32 TaxID=3461496 RepID=UPI004045286B